MGPGRPPSHGAGVGGELVQGPCRRSDQRARADGSSDRPFRGGGAMKALRCRFCNEPLVEPFADLGMAPLSNSYLRADELDRMEPFYPLIAYVCGGCFLVQLPAVATPEQIFGEYAYFSSVADTWVTHARNYCRLMRDRLKLDRHSQFVEIVSNDGYLLQFFKAEGIPVLGIEPATNVAVEAR